MRSQTDGAGWTARRAIRGGGTDIPVTRPEPRRAIPLALIAPLLAQWTADVDRSKRAYYGSKSYYDKHNAATQKSLRYRARQKEAGK